MGCGGGTYRYGYMARSRSEKEICRVTKREERGSSKGKEGELRFVTLPQPPSPPLAAPRRDMRDGRRPSVRPSFRPSVRVFFFLLVFIGEGRREGGKEPSQLQPDEKGDGSCYSVIYVCMYSAWDGVRRRRRGLEEDGCMYTYAHALACLLAPPIQNGDVLQTMKMTITLSLYFVLRPSH